MYNKKEAGQDHGSTNSLHRLPIDIRTRTGRIIHRRGLTGIYSFTRPQTEELEDSHKAGRQNLRQIGKAIEKEVAKNPADQDPDLLENLRSQYHRISTHAGATRIALDATVRSRNRTTVQEKPTNINRDTLIIHKPEPSFGVTTTSQKIRTENLGAAIAVGGITHYKKREALFMTDWPDSDPNNHLSILSKELELGEREGLMVVFTSNPEPPGTFRGFEGNDIYSYTEALKIFLDKLKSQFRDFDIYNLPYGTHSDDPASYAEIDRKNLVASTNIISAKLDRPK